MWYVAYDFAPNETTGSPLPETFEPGELGRERVYNIGAGGLGDSSPLAHNFAETFRAWIANKICRRRFVGAILFECIKQGQSESRSFGFRENLICMEIFSRLIFANI